MMFGRKIYVVTTPFQIKSYNVIILNSNLIVKYKTTIVYFSLNYNIQNKINQLLVSTQNLSLSSLKK